jgi:HEAT repeat protein
MREPTVFALHLARLLSQVLTAPDDRATHQIMDDLLGSTREPVTLAWENWQLVAEGEVIAASLPGVRDLTGRMAAHGVRQIAFDRAPEPGEVMAAMWVLARDPVPGDGGADAVGRLRKFSVTRVRFEPVAAPPSLQRPANPGAAYNPSAGLGESGEHEGGTMLDGFELEELEPLPMRNRVETPPASHQAIPAAPQETPDQILARLGTITSVNELSAALESIAAEITSLVAARRTKAASRLTAGLIEQEKRLTADEARTPFAFTMRRIGKTTLFRDVATELPRDRESRELFMTVLGRFGDEGVDPLIEQLVYADQARERRMLFDAIVELGCGVPTLIHMLDDSRWYVVRNAAELLGRLKATRAQAELTRMMGHDEPRVRRSAAGALARLGTPEALSVLRGAMRDAESDVRVHAVAALGASRQPAAAATLIQALEQEQDAEVRAAILVALGRIGTPEAVQRIIDEASAADGRFRRKHNTPARMAAIRALSEARTTEAIAALRNLAGDRDAAVREAATKGLAARPAVGTAAGWG